MGNKDNLYPWQQIEEHAFHAFREWPLWLVLRARELLLQGREPAQQTGSPAGGAEHPQEAGAGVTKPRRD
jgi:hypothetical protein